MRTGDEETRREQVEDNGRRRSSRSDPPFHGDRKRPARQRCGEHDDDVGDVEPPEGKDDVGVEEPGGGDEAPRWQVPPEQEVWSEVQWFEGRLLLELRRREGGVSEVQPSERCPSGDLFKRPCPPPEFVDEVQPDGEGSK